MDKLQTKIIFHNNLCSAESGHAVAAGVLNFQHDGIGHEIADMCVR